MRISLVNARKKGLLTVVLVVLMIVWYPTFTAEDLFTTLPILFFLTSTFGLFGASFIYLVVSIVLAIALYVVWKHY